MIKTEFEPAKTKEDFIRNFTEARNQIFDAVEGMSDEDLDRPIVEDFSAKDLMAHILEWDWSALCNSKDFLAGKDPDFTPDYDNDTFNEIAVAIWKEALGSRVLEELMLSTQEVLNYVNSLTKEEFFRDRGLRFINTDGVERVVNLPWFLGEFEHDTEHAGQIREWREREVL